MKILCLLFGHKWEYRNIPLINSKTCKRCGKHQMRYITEDFLIKGFKWRTKKNA